MTSTDLRRAAATNDVTAREPGAFGLAVILVGAYLAVLDFFIVNVALPSIGRDLHASDGLVELVVAGYAIAYALTLVIGGRLGDAFGRRRLFGIGMTAFALTSLLCGLAPTAPALVATRAMQGFSAALMVPQVLATIQATTSGTRRSRALGFFGAVAGLAAGTGQVLGGLLVSADIAGSDWRPIFLVNVPVAVAALLVLRHAVPETYAQRRAHIDLTGAVLLGLAVLSVMVPLTLGRTEDWPLWMLLLLVFAPVAAGVFARAELQTERAGRTPLVPPSLLRHVSMRRGLTLAIPFFAGFGGFLFVYALATQRFLNWSALKAGLSIAPMAGMFLVASLVTARLLARFGRRVLTAGGILQFTGLIVTGGYIVATWPHPTPLGLAPGLTIHGLGLGLIASPMFGVILADVPLNEAGAGGGVLATNQQISLALGTGLLGTLFLSLSSRASIGGGDAFAILIGIEAVLALLITALSIRLPQVGAH